MDRETIQNLYIRICKDSGFRLDWYKAAYLTADILSIHPLEVGFAFPHVDIMERIANDDHPATKRV